MRLFTGIDLPENINAGLQQLLVQLRPTAHLKWTPDYNLHITLKFIGSWPEERLTELTKALAGLSPRAPISVDVRGLVWMPNPHRPRLFWAAVNAPELAPLNGEIENALEPLGVAKETRAYTPHLTLARVRMPAPLQKTREAIAKLESVDFGSFSADRFWLYLSEPGAANSVYTKLAPFPFSA
ncbi:MAG TPA: RNA 2',3'-cyclic phosphodiesterase [Bryobacteraceae bacterium]|nr:RNA 2',3'-cyclic phosphodiesterase [Bryobacteraceae bacterium]